MLIKKVTRKGGDLTEGVFWKDIEQYIDYWMNDDSESKNSAVRTHNEAIPIGELLPSDRSSLKSEVIPSGKDSETNAISNFSQRKDALHERTSLHLSPTSPSSIQKSESVRAGLKNRYIVGKRSGKDIAALQGGWIVRENEVITAEVVSRAEEEGKLVDLIVHMVIDEFGMNV